MIKILAIVTALVALLTAGSGITLIFGGGESTGHVILGLLTVVLVLVQSHQAYWKFYKR